MGKKEKKRLALESSEKKKKGGAVGRNTTKVGEEGYVT